MTKANCYKCKWRGTVPGDVHSCRHPDLGQTTDNPLVGIIDAMSGGSSLMQAGADSEYIDKYLKESTVGDYSYLLAVSMEYVNVE